MHRSQWAVASPALSPRWRQTSQHIAPRAAARLVQCVCRRVIKPSPAILLARRRLPSRTCVSARRAVFTWLICSVVRRATPRRKRRRELLRSSPHQGLRSRVYASTGYTRRIFTEQPRQSAVRGRCRRSSTNLTVAPLAALLPFVSICGYPVAVCPPTQDCMPDWVPLVLPRFTHFEPLSWWPCASSLGCRSRRR